MFGFRNTFIYDAEGNPCYKTWSMGAFVDKAAGKLKRVDDATGIRFLSPMLAKGKYTLELRIATMKPNWTDKRRNQYGSTGHKVEITHVMIE